MSSGETEIAVIVGADTVTNVEPVTEPKAAVIVADPPARPVTFPEASTVASEIVDELQLTCAVISRELPSL
jgi:hypothetical protein